MLTSRHTEMGSPTADRKKRSKKKHRSKRHKSSRSSSSSSEEDDEVYGPQVPFRLAATSASFITDSSSTNYGADLLQGEGRALAEFVKKNERIPRRGEVGYDGDKIDEFESLGYVMSGSRHRKMEAVRKRKENQVFSAEEKRLLVINETKRRDDREAQVLDDMRRLIQRKEREDASKH
ncbi:hypothetical protein BASA81_001646 [Batrachochytrium salamandrivorans]|nr:hypothetical protein BASA81_001646 [Batrachochytrium salamandrivorans]